MSYKQSEKVSYKLKISDKDRVSGRFMSDVRKALLKAAIDEKESNRITQQEIADKLGVNRSVINRWLRGDGNLTLRSIGEIAWALGYKPKFSLDKKMVVKGANSFSEAKLDAGSVKPTRIHLNNSADAWNPSKSVTHASYEPADA
ncbi:helix-turn-helix domain-containing protein [Brucella anthropi]|uniref:helix-turn-helix domain-containing protein n=1 Tax=Brucella anthropi TaxID=529 RepID=UPI001639C6CD|nr:helix-turn-helix transcriptional regulator [Brucella anthropi]